MMRRQDVAVEGLLSFAQQINFHEVGFRKHQVAPLAHVLNSPHRAHALICRTKNLDDCDDFFRCDIGDSQEMLVNFVVDQAGRDNRLGDV